MPYNSVGQYTGTMKPYDHVGNIIPDIEHCEGERPSFEYRPAAWLPVRFYDKHYENWDVVLPGKCIALDPDGRIMPAHYGLTGATVTYTASDVTAGTIDVATGAAVTTAKVVTLSLLDGTITAGWTAANAGVAAGGIHSGFMGRPGIDFIDGTQKYAIGVAPYAFLQSAGDGSALDDGFNPVAFRQHNYNMQHQVTPLCDYVIKLPLIPGQTALEGLSNAWSAADITYGTADGWRTRADLLATVARYGATGTYPCLATYNVCACPLANFPIAKNTPRTLITSTLTGLLVNEVGSMDAILAAGDWWMDYDVGVLFVFSAGGSTLPAIVGHTITYYHYAAVPGTLPVFACMLSSTTNLMPGDFVKCGTDSNFVVADPAADNICDILGQIIAIDDRFPKDYLDRVRTAYNPALRTDSSGSMANATAGSASVNLGQLDQMPGSANGGMPGLISYSGAANKIVLINLISR